MPSIRAVSGCADPECGAAAALGSRFASGAVVGVDDEPHPVAPSTTIPNKHSDVLMMGS
jgi:hypothetical protein